METQSEKKPTTSADFEKKVLEVYPEAFLQKLPEGKHYAVFSNATLKQERLSLNSLEGKTATTKKEAWKEAYEKVSKNNITQEQGKKESPKNDENIGYLKNQIKYLGFGESADLIKDLVKNIEQGEKNFVLTLNSDKASKGNKASFELLFNRSEQSGRYFLNNFIANLEKTSVNQNNGMSFILHKQAFSENQKNSLILSHKFPINTTGFSAKQAINLLEGRNVLGTVHFDLAKEPEGAFISFKLNEPKNDYGNFKWNVIDKKNTRPTSSIVEAYSLKFDSDKHKDITIKSLERGNVVSVKFNLNEKDIEGKAVLNPSTNTLKLYSMDMERLNDNKPIVAEKLDIESKNKNTIKQSR